MSKPPLAQLASIVSDEYVGSRLSTESKDALKNLLTAYDKLLALFNEKKDAFKDPAGTGAKTVQQCEELADFIEQGLETIFFEDSVFKDRVRKYCVF